MVCGVREISENITGVSIVDKFLEHMRIFVFANGGDEKIFISSADWMTRNLDHRCEVAVHIRDKKIQKNLKDASIAYVKVWETDTSCATYRP